MKLLGGLSRSDFLDQYWQKKALMIEGAVPDFQTPISAEELAGLACEEEVESRLIMEQPDKEEWWVKHGPFDEADFQDLPETSWTLLVQSVDHFVPEVAALLEQFDFVPAWRLDDIMISYAPTGGSVGPHLDNYDVFLFQASGKRHWHINPSDYSEDDLIDGLDLRILENFKSKQDWVLEPGDMLYVPAGVAHHGIAVDDCLTFSIGFRAPKQSELWDHYLFYLQAIGKDFFYTDPELELQESRGEIKHKDLNAVREHMLSSLNDETLFSEWFGQYISEHKPVTWATNNTELNHEDFIVQLKQLGECQRHGFIRLFYIEQENEISFFYAGSHITLAHEQLSLVRYLCSHYRIDYLEIKNLIDDDDDLNLLFELYKHDCLYFQNDD